MWSIILDFDRFASCQSVDCIGKERTYLEERSQLGDPNAMYAMSLLYSRHSCSILVSVSAYTTTLTTRHSPRRTCSSPPMEEAHWHPSLSVLFLLSLNVATRYQIGYHHVVNLTRAFEIILPVWRHLYRRNESLFDALYASSSVEVPPFPRFHVVANGRDFPQL